MKCFITKEEFDDNCWMFSTGLDLYVQSISGENKWWFDKCYVDVLEDKYFVFFKSYITPEYRNFSLTVTVEKIGTDYEFKHGKPVTDLA